MISPCCCSNCWCCCCGHRLCCFTIQSFAMVVNVTQSPGHLTREINDVGLKCCGFMDCPCLLNGNDYKLVTMVGNVAFTFYFLLYLFYFIYFHVSLNVSTLSVSLEIKLARMKTTSTLIALLMQNHQARPISV